MDLHKNIQNCICQKFFILLLFGNPQTSRDYTHLLILRVDIIFNLVQGDIIDGCVSSLYR